MSLTEDMYNGVYSEEIHSMFPKVRDKMMSMAKRICTRCGSEIVNSADEAGCITCAHCGEKSCGSD